MKILVVTPTYLPIVGGAEVGINQIYSRIAERHEVRILTPDWGIPQLDKASGFADLDTVRFQDKWSALRIRGHKFVLGIIPPFSLSYFPAIERQIREFAPDVINLHYALPGGWAAVSHQRRFNIPVVLSLIGRDVPGPGVPPAWGRYTRSISSRCTGTLFISDYCRQMLFGDATPKNSKVIPYATDVQRHSPMDKKAEFKAKLGLPADGVMLLALQRLAREKRVDVVIRAMNDLASKDPKAYLVIAGGGPWKDRLTELAASYGLGDRIRLLGRVSDEVLADLYQAADIFVFHSIYETFGVVLVEAMAAGLPIVTVNNTAIPELVKTGENGILVPTCDHAAMADAIKTLVDDPETRIRMGHASRESAMQYNWDSVARQYEEALQKAAAGFRNG